MRIRTIKPEFYRSDDVATLTREQRLLFIGLWSYVDDNGVGIDDARHIAADLFALDDDQTEVRSFIREGLATLSRVLLVTRYEVDGKRYLFITGWDQHQRIDRPGKSRYPRPPLGSDPLTSPDADPHPVDGNQSRQSREGVAPGTEEQGNRGEEEKTPPRSARSGDSLPAGFADWWAVYPRRDAKIAAVKAYRAALKRGVSPEHLLSGAVRYAAEKASSERRFIAQPATWLNRGSYDDEPDRRPTRGTSARTVTGRAVASVDAAFEEYERRHGANVHQLPVRAEGA